MIIETNFTDNSLMVLQSTVIVGVAGGMGGLAGGGVAGALAGTSLSMTTQALLTGAAGVSGGSTARLLYGTGITPATVTQDALMGGAGDLQIRCCQRVLAGDSAEALHHQPAISG